MIKKIHLIVSFIVLLFFSAQAQVDKTILESHFRSGNAPGQSEFHDLINSCYNYSIAKGLIYEAGTNSLRAEVTLDLLKQMLADTLKINRERIDVLIHNLEQKSKGRELNLLNKIQINSEDFEFNLEDLNIRILDSLFDHRITLNEERLSLELMLQDTAKQLSLNTESKFNLSQVKLEGLKLDMASLDFKILDSLLSHRFKLDTGLTELKLVVQDSAEQLRLNTEYKYILSKANSERLKLNMESMNLKILDSLSTHSLNLNTGFTELKLVLQDTAQSLRASVDQKLSLLKIKNDIIHQDMAFKLRALEIGLKDTTEVIRTSLKLLEDNLRNESVNADEDIKNLLSETRDRLLLKIDSLAQAQNADKIYQDNRMSTIEANHNILNDTVIKMKTKLDTLNYTEHNFTQSLLLKLDNIEDGATRSDNNFADSLVTKLLAIEKNANNYQLPMSTHSKLGGLTLSGDFVLHEGKVFSALDPEKIDRWYATDTIVNDWSNSLEIDQKWTKVRMKIPTGSVDADGNKTYDYGEFNPPYKFIYDDFETSYYEYNGTDESNVILGEHEKQKKVLGEKNTMIGHKAGYNLFEGGEENVIIGFEAGQSSANVSNNVFVGSRSGQNILGSADNAGEMNVAIGSRSMSGRNNNKESLALGYASMELGEQNSSIAMGTGAMKNNSGENNIAIGYETAFSAEGSNNIQNINLGYRSAYSSMTAQRNIGIGDSTAFSNLSGKGNLFIGHGSGKTNTQSGNLFIGHGIDDGGSDKMLIGNNGKVLISGDFNTGTVSIDKLSSSVIKIDGDKEVINASAQFIGEGGVNTPTVNASTTLSAAGIEIIRKEGAITVERYAQKAHAHSNADITTDGTHRFVTDTEKSVWNNKVDKVIGKDLSSNDFTLVLKNKLDRIAEEANRYVHPGTHPASIIITDANNRFTTDTEKTKLAGIQAGANKYTHPSKHAASMITTDATHRFVSDADKTKLAGIQSGANNYTHPSKHTASMITTDASNRFTTDTEKLKLAGIQVGANKYTHPSKHAASMITTDATHRFVSDADKTKLAGIQSGANKYTHPSKHAASMITTDATHRFVSDTEKTKLAGIEIGANKYVHPNKHDASTITTDADHQFVSETEKSNWTAGKIPIGGIIMWSGANIPAGWALCDGSTQEGKTTPDLRGRFIVGNYPGKSAYDIGKTGGTAGEPIKTSAEGEHTHSTSVSAYKLLESDIPSHKHTFKNYMYIEDNRWDDTRLGSMYGNEYIEKGIGSGDHDFNNNRVFYKKMDTEGYGKPSYTQNSHSHTATVSKSPIHDHKVEIPYYVLAFIMRVK
jgi:hypothetical protein